MYTHTIICTCVHSIAHLEAAWNLGSCPVMNVWQALWKFYLTNMILFIKFENNLSTQWRHQQFFLLITQRFLLSFKSISTLFQNCEQKNKISCSNMPFYLCKVYNMTVHYIAPYPLFAKNSFKDMNLFCYTYWCNFLTWQGLMR